MKIIISIIIVIAIVFTSGLIALKKASEYMKDFE